MKNWAKSWSGRRPCRCRIDDRYSRPQVHLDGRPTRTTSDAAHPGAAGLIGCCPGALAGLRCVSGSAQGA